jgi:hypothetical protein
LMTRSAPPVSCFLACAYISSRPTTHCMCVPQRLCSVIFTNSRRIMGEASLRSTPVSKRRSASACTHLNVTTRCFAVVALNRVVALVWECGTGTRRSS